MLQIPAPALSAALSAASKIVETRNTLPLLTMVMMKADAGRLTITTSNLDIEYRQTLHTDVSEPFTCCVEAKRFAEMAGKATGNLKISVDGSIMTVKGRATWRLPAVPATDFPIMPVESLSKPMAVTGLADIVKRTVWAASTAPTQAYISGVYLNGEAGKARWVSTDGYRLASLTTTAKWPKGAPDVIIPAPLAKAMADAGDGSLEWDAAKLRYVAEDVVITGKMIDGTFPDYRRHLDASPGEPYAIDAIEFLDAVRRVRIASDAQQRKLRITRRAGKLHIRIEGTSGFEGEEEIDADCTDGFECGVNADFLMGMLAAIDTDSIAIEHDAPGSVMHLRPVAQGKDVKFEGLMWPLRI